MPKPQEPFLEEAIQLHDAGIAGDKEAVKKAHQLLQKIRTHEPYHPLIEAYYGSATTLLGRDAIDPMERLNKAMKGLKILDRVVASVPDNMTVRLLRAYVSYKLPEEFFHRTKTAIEDFQSVKTAYEKDPNLISQDTYWQLLYNLGDAHQRIGNAAEAQKVWNELLASTTDPQYQALIKTK